MFELIRDWYHSQYPNDPMYDAINPKATFAGLMTVYYTNGVEIARHPFLDEILDYLAKTFHW